MVPVNLLANKAYISTRERANAPEVNADFRVTMICPGSGINDGIIPKKYLNSFACEVSIEKWVLIGCGGYRQCLHCFRLDESPNAPNTPLPRFR